MLHFAQKSPHIMLLQKQKGKKASLVLIA